MAEIRTAAAVTLIDRRRTADRIYLGALVFNGALTAFWVVSLATGRDTPFFRSHILDGEAMVRIAVGLLVFYVLWGLIWYGVKTLLLNKFVGFSKEERRRSSPNRRGSCWRSLQTNSRPPTEYKMNTMEQCTIAIGLISNHFHKFWCLFDSRR